jgi:hypothetical protein
MEMPELLDPTESFVHFATFMDWAFMAVSALAFVLMAAARTE